MTLAFLFFGFLSDRKGHKLSLEICRMVSRSPPRAGDRCPQSVMVFPIFFLRGAVSAGTFVSGISIVYEFTDADTRPTYIGLANTIPGVTGRLRLSSAGWLAGAISYQAMFFLAAVIGAISWALLRFAVRVPRKLNPSPRPARAALHQRNGAFSVGKAEIERDVTMSGLIAWG